MEPADANICIERASVRHLDALVPLFDAYRRFYRNPGDIEGARRFLSERLNPGESVIFVAALNEVAIGFTQLFPSFSSGAMKPILILNDLFVSTEARRLGAGTALLRKAADYGREMGVARLTLSTELDNVNAKALYEKCGWKRDMTFAVYHLFL